MMKCLLQLKEIHPNVGSLMLCVVSHLVQALVALGAADWSCVLLHVLSKLLLHWKQLNGLVPV